MSAIFFKSSNKSPIKSVDSIIEKLSLDIDKNEKLELVIESESDIERHLSQLSSTEAKKIIFLFSNNPLTENIIKAIPQNLSKSIILICFGESYFLVNKLNKIKNKNLHLFTFSKSYRNLLDHLTVYPVSSLPPIIKSDQFFHNQDSTKQLRESLKLSPTDIVFLYSGRLSMQKNSLLLINMFKKISNINPSIKLLIIGPIDSLAESHKGTIQNIEYAEEVRKKLIDTKNNNIIYLEKIPRTLLNKYYNCSDAFISLSTHHGEILGLAPIEASLTGLPCFLTNWGGYKDYKDYHCASSSYYSIKQDAPIPLNLLVKDILSFKKRNHLQRKQDSESIHNKLSQINVLKSIYDKINYPGEIMELCKNDINLKSETLDREEYKALFKYFYE